MEWLIEIIGEVIVGGIAEFFKPKLEIAVANDAFVERKHPKSGELQKWAQLELRTPSKRRCKGCLVNSNLVQKINADGSVQKDNLLNERVVLRWAGALEEYPADVDKETPGRIDFFRLDGSRLILSSNPDGSPKESIENSGKYKFHLDVDSKNARTYMTVIEVESQGLSSEPSVEVIKSIKHLKRPSDRS